MRDELRFTVYQLRVFFAKSRWFADSLQNIVKYANTASQYASMYDALYACACVRILNDK